MKKVLCFALSVLLLTGLGLSARASDEPASAEAPLDAAVDKAPPAPEEDGSLPGPITFSGAWQAEGVMPADPEDLLEGYIEQLILPETEDSSGPALDGLSDAYLDRLTGADRVFFDFIRERIGEIAVGERTSTVFLCSAEELGLDRQWTAAELGVDSLDDLPHEALDKMMAVDFDRIRLTLTNCCPYEIWWWDLSFEWSCTAVPVRDSKSGELRVCLTEVELRLPVNFEKTDQRYTVQSDRLARARTAAKNARDIVAKYADADDYSKLRGYAAEICEFVDYAYDDYYEYYGGPRYAKVEYWTVINVFDGDPDTNILCAGYAEAFQYLCDLTEFRSGTDCILVSGTEYRYITFTGTHAWNIVTLYGKRYIVDMTFVDGDTTRTLWEFFLAGMGGDPRDILTIPYKSDIIHYVYDAPMFDIFGEQALTIESESFRHPDDVPDLDGDGVLTPNDATIILRNRAGSAFTPNDAAIILRICAGC